MSLYHLDLERRGSAVRIERDLGLVSSTSVLITSTAVDPMGSWVISLSPMGSWVIFLSFSAKKDKKSGGSHHLIRITI